MTQELRVNARRLWDSLMVMAEIGATDRGGVCRLALTDADKQGRDLWREWCQGAGCTVQIDAMGNMFARRPGRDAGRAAVGSGSHLDSQPTGGKFDGAYGALAALEVLRTLNDNDIETIAPTEFVVWTNEEGARFAPAMVGAGVFAGVFDLDYAWSRRDRDGRSIGEELKRIGYRGEAAVGGRRFGAFFEAHIEQGPILEAEGKTIGVVTGVQGMRWYDVAVIGAEAHAGPTPMELRRDAMAAASLLLPRIYQLAAERPPYGRATVGEFRLSPGSRNTVPGRVEFSVDVRHPDEATLAEMDRALRGAVAALGKETGLEATLIDVWESRPVSFDRDCVAAVRAAAERLGYGHMDMVSGAGHDSVYVSRVAPTGMVFIPCEHGVSHNESERATPGDVEAGANVLLQAMLEAAGVAA